MARCVVLASRPAQEGFVGIASGARAAGSMGKHRSPLAFNMDAGDVERRQIVEGQDSPELVKGVWVSSRARGD